MAGVDFMAFLHYGILYFNKLKGLNKTDLIILTYINSNKSATTLKLSDWAFLIGSTTRTISNSIKKLTELNLILNKSNRNKLVLYPIDKMFLTSAETKLLNDFYKKLSK